MLTFNFKLTINGQIYVYIYVLHKYSCLPFSKYFFDVLENVSKKLKPFLIDIFVLSDIKVILPFPGDSVKPVQNGILMLAPSCSFYKDLENEVGTYSLTAVYILKLPKIDKIVCLRESGETFPIATIKNTYLIIHQHSQNKIFYFGI